MNNHHYLKILALALALAAQPARAGLVHRYSFDDTVSTTNAFDSVGGAHGTNFGGVTITGGQAVFNGVAGSYIQLPNDLVLPDTNLTMEVWVTDGTQATWSRIYDFGNGTPVNMFLTEHPGGVGLRFVLKQSDAVGEQQINAAPISSGVENHIVVTYNATNQTGSMFVNGVLVAQNTAMTTTPASMGTTPLDYLGRSQYAADPYFQGSINELRIYNVAVGALQAAVDAQLGPNTLFTDPGTPTSLTLNSNVVTTMNVGDVQSLQVTANFSTVTNINLTPTASYSSTATNILIVDNTGRIGAVGAGTATISAYYRGVTNSVSITVNAAIVTMTHRYSFDNTNVTDSVGGANGTLVGTATVTNGQLVLDGTAGTYLSLPPDLFTNYNGGATFEAWVTDNGSAAWARIYDFGNSVGGNGTSYMFLALNGGGGIRGAYNLGAGEQGVDSSSRPLPGAPAHFVFSQNAITETAAIYINGVQVAANTNFTFTPASVGPTANDWLGQSQFTGDPAFHGSYDEFRVYNGALDPLQIAIDSATGPTNIVTNPGALQSVSLSVATNTMLLNLSQNASVLATYANVANVPVTSIPPITYSSSNTNFVTVDANGVITAKGIGSATVTASFNGKSDNKVITVVQLPLALAHRYSFDDTVSTTNAFDSVGGAHGTLFGTATVSGGQLQLPGTAGSYVQLPNGLLTNDASITMEVWVTDNAQATWSRVYDFGNGPPVNMFLTEHPGGVGLRFVLKQSNAVGEQQLNAPPVAAGVENHIVVTYNVLNHTGLMYVNGVPVAQNTAMTTTPASLGTTLLNYLGKSQYGDPYFNGSINELRIWSGAISPAQIITDYQFGPNTIVTNSLGAIQALSLTAPASLANGARQSVVVLGTFANFPTTNLIMTGFYPIVYSSSDRSVVNVDANGILTGGFPGTATITATYNGLSARADVTVTEPTPPVIGHRWSFDAAVNGTNVTDSVGGDTGVLQGTATVSGGQLVLGTNGFVDIGINAASALISGYNALTIEAWANIGANPAGARHLFSFGDTVPAANYTRLRARSGGGNTILGYNSGTGELIALRSSFLRGPFHIVAVYNPPPIGVMSLYLDGKLQATNSMVDPLGNLAAAVAFIGGSVVSAGDSNLTANIDEFRIYNGALDLPRIRTSIASGPTNQVFDAGTITSLTLNVETNVVAGTLQEAHVTAGSATVSNIDLSATPSLANFTSSNTNVITVAGDGRLQAVAPGTATVSATYRGATSNSKTITVVAAPSLVLTHRYSFNGDATDSIGIANGRLYGQAAVSGGSLVLDGANSYLELPEHMIDGYPSITLEAWATLNVNNGWARLWDIGNENIAGGGGLSYLYYTTHVNGTVSRLLINGGGGEIAAEQVNATFATLENTNQHHIVLTHDGSNHLESVYIDGNLITSTNVNTPLTNVVDINTWIGKSQFADPYLIGQVAEARIYYGVMSAAQVAGDFASGPDSLVPRPQLHVGASGGSLTISWPDTATGFILESSATMAAGSWTTVTAGQTDSNGTITVTVPTTGADKFFRLRHP